MPEPSLPPVLLFVDDVPDVLELYTQHFEERGYTVLCANDPREAVAMAKASVVDAVVMDLVMPTVEGIDATRAIEEIRAMRDVPVIVVTASASPKLSAMASAAGAAAVLIKPVGLEELEATISAARS